MKSFKFPFAASNEPFAMAPIFARVEVFRTRVILSFMVVWSGIGVRPRARAGRMLLQRSMPAFQVLSTTWMAKDTRPATRGYPADKELPGRETSGFLQRTVQCHEESRLSSR
jgi:hypothetical protein